MESTGECEVQVQDAQGKPLEGLEVNAWPNVRWWNSGSQIYCSPLYRDAARIADPDTKAIPSDEGKDHYPAPFSAVTDKSGRAVLRNLPPRKNSFRVSEGLDKVNQYRNYDGKVEITPGKPARVNVTMAPLDD
jgi:hypothetical protein